MAPFHNKSILPVLIVSLSLSTAATRDTITPTQPLADNETLVSAGGTFALGFFTTNNSDDRRRYIGIWYNKIPVQTIVWVANRANPVIGSTGQLSVTANGTVTITNGETSNVVWSTVVTDPIGLSNLVVELLDNGNLVVKGEERYNSTKEYYVWQSFDYPTDTLLPGMKLGVDRIAGLSSSNLTAWKSADDPSPGEYYAEMVVGASNSPEMYLFNRSSKVWRSGPWDGNQLGGALRTWNYPSNFVSDSLTYSFVNNHKEAAAFSFQVSDQTITPMLKVSRPGVLQLLVWLSEVGLWVTFWSALENPCGNIGWCGSYAICVPSTNSPTSICRCLQRFAPKNPAHWESSDYADGCVRVAELDCRKGTDTTFLAVKGVKLPESSISSVAETSNLDECRSECLKDCSCAAYAIISVAGAGCVFWVSDLLDVVQLSGGAGLDLYIRNAASQPQKANWRVVVVVIVSLLSGALLLSCFIFFLWRRKKRGRVILGRKIFFSHKLDEDDRSRRKDLDLPLFTFRTIAAATESFSAKNKLGQDGFGPVYKGMLGGDKEIAVKRLAKSSQQGAEEFKNEVMLIAKLQHRNLVRLLGCCIQGEERMLIYEYMPNRSLDAFIFGDESKNIRLLARLFGGDETDYNTRKVVGTYGYMSPEYAMEGIFSVKSDVYSFGVLLLEIISGKKNRGLYAFSPYLNLVAHAWSLWKEDKSLELVDEAMNNNFLMNDVLKCIKIGLLCVQDHPEDRPLMSSVTEMLGASADIASLPHPKQPGFIARMGPFELENISNNRDACTSNELTVTLDGR